jgi:hypothetical protein
MRIVVVLPLPLAPRKPQISPLADLQRQAVDDLARAEALAQIADVDDEFIAPSWRARRDRPHLDRLAGIEPAA